MRRSDHPSRPSAITCCRFSALKTLPIPAAGVQPTAQVNVSAPGAPLAGFQVSINGRFWVSTEGDDSAAGDSEPTSGDHGRRNVPALLEPTRLSTVRRTVSPGRWAAQPVYPASGASPSFDG